MGVKTRRKIKERVSKKVVGWRRPSTLSVSNLRGTRGLRGVALKEH